MKIDKPVTTVRDCVSTFVSVKPPDIFKGVLQTIPIHFCGNKKRTPLKNSWDISICVCGNQIRIFCGVFVVPKLNQTMSTALSQNKVYYMNQ